MRTIIEVGSDPRTVYGNIRMLLARANGDERTDTHIPRTERPVRFGWDRVTTTMRGYPFSTRTH